MATRSRRSGASGGETLNPAMIHLYDAGRLRRELKDRGLDTTGNRNVLADRLQAAVLAGRNNSRRTYSPPPQSEKPVTRRGTKRASKGSEKSEGNENEETAAIPAILEHQTPPKAKKKRFNEEADEINLIEESFSIELSNISSIDEVQMEAERGFLPNCVSDTAAVGQGQPSITQAGISPSAPNKIQPTTEAVPENVDIVQPEKRTPEIKIRIKSPKKPRISPDAESKSQHTEKLREKKTEKKVKAVVFEEPPSSSSSDEELKWLKKTRREKKARKLHEEQVEPAEILPAAKSVSAEIGMATKKKDDEGSGKDLALKEEKGSLKIKFKTNLLQRSTERTLEPKYKESSGDSNSAKEAKVHVGATEATTSGETITNRETSLEKTKPSVTPPLSAAEKPKEQPSRKRIPLRMQARIDVLDSIFDKQAQLLSSKYKTEQERALERQKLEMLKRRQNAVPPVVTSSVSTSPVVEKRRHVVEFVLPPKPSYEQQQEHHVAAPYPSQRTPPEFHSHPLPPPPPSSHRASAVDEKRLLAKLPPPPPPPPLLSCPTTRATPQSVSSSPPSVTEQPRDANTEGTPLLESRGTMSTAFATPKTPCSVTDSPSIEFVRTPPSVPVYKSPSEAVLLEHLHSTEASTSSSSSTTVSVAKMDSERIKEMASALQAVFARLGNVPSPPAPPPTLPRLPEGVDLKEASGIATFAVDSSDRPLPQEVPASPTVEERRAEITDGTMTASFRSEPRSPDFASMTSTVTMDYGTEHQEDTTDPSSVGQNNSSNSLLQENEMSTPVNALLNLADDGAEVMEEVITEFPTAAPEGAQNDRKDLDVASVVEQLIRATVSGFGFEENTDKEEIERKPDISEELLRDPRRLLQKATDVLKNLQSLEIAAEQAASAENRQYEQLPLDDKYEEEDEEDKPLPEFHGEPVPDSDDDIVIEGVTRRRSSKKNLVQEEEPIPGDEVIEIDFYNADLNIKASETSQEVIDPDNGDGFALMWGGARSTYGIRIPADVSDFPAVLFQIKLLECLTLKHLPFEEMDAHNVRIGWSTQNSANILGEAPHSYAYDLLSKKATNNFFTDYGEPCQVGDVIISCLDLAPGKIHFWKNTEYLGVAFTEVSFEEGEIIFPHVCTKNYKLSVNYGDSKSEDWISVDELQKDDLSLSADFAPIYFSKLDRSVLVRGLVPPSSKSECTVLMMVGLPGVGKTTWVRRYLREHPQEQWTLLSTDTILAAMKVNGVPRSRVHQGRWDMVMGLIAKALNRSLQLACRRRRNYIIDQTNVSKEARRRKLSQFKDFQRKCVVIIPTEEEMIARQMKQSRMDGAGPIPVEAMLELKAMISIPNTEMEPIEDVYFIEPPLEQIGQAIELVQRFNEEARPWCQKRRGRRGEPLRQNETRSARLSNADAPVITANTNASESNQLNCQPSPAVSRSNEGFCGFGREVPQSLTSSVVPSSWAERKNSSTN